MTKKSDSESDVDESLRNGSAMPAKKGTKMYKRARNMFVISFLCNLFFMGMLFSFFIKELVNNSQCDNEPTKTLTETTQKSVPATQMSASAKQKNVFLSCEPCQPMMRASDVEMRYRINKTYICCKQSKENLKIPNKGQLLEKCHSQAFLDRGQERPAALLYIKLEKPDCSKGETLHWNLNNQTSYLNGGISYEDVPYGKLKVPTQGMYAIYTYLQFDSYTTDIRIQRPQPEMHALIKGNGEILMLNKFMLRKDSYTQTQIGPIITEMNAGDAVYVTVSNLEYISKEAKLSVFGIYKV